MLKARRNFVSACIKKKLPVSTAEISSTHCSRAIPHLGTHLKSNVNVTVFRERREDDSIFH